MVETQTQTDQPPAQQNTSNQKKNPAEILRSFLSGTATQAEQKRTERVPYPTPPGIEMSERFPGMVKPLSEEVVYEWNSPSRPFKARKKQFFTSLITIVILLCLILFFAGQILPVAVVMAVGFMAYVLATVPPHDISQRITTYGIRIEKELYYWEELGRFWFEDKLGSKVVLIEVARFPNRLSLVLTGPEQQTEVAQILSEVLLQQRPEKTWVEKAGDWLQKKFPLELDV